METEAKLLPSIDHAQEDAGTVIWEERRKARAPGVTSNERQSKYEGKPTVKAREGEPSRNKWE